MTDKPKTEDCPRCGGVGRILDPTKYGAKTITIKCPDCEGKR